MLIRMVQVRGSLFETGIQIAQFLRSAFWLIFHSFELVLLRQVYILDETAQILIQLCATRLWRRRFNLNFITGTGWIRLHTNKIFFLRAPALFIFCLLSLLPNEMLVFFSFTDIIFAFESSGNLSWYYYRKYLEDIWSCSSRVELGFWNEKFLIWFCLKVGYSISPPPWKAPDSFSISSGFGLARNTPVRLWWALPRNESFNMVESKCLLVASPLKEVMIDNIYGDLLSMR